MEGGEDVLIEIVPLLLPPVPLGGGVPSNGYPGARKRSPKFACAWIWR